MTKDDVMGAFNGVLNNYIYGIASPRLLPAEEWDEMEFIPATFEGPQGELLHVEMGDMVRALRVPDQRQAIADEFEAALKRMLVREAFEVVLWYGEETGQHNLVRTAPWFQFARILRNTVSHKQAGVMREWPDDLTNKGTTQVTWGTRKLDASMVGKPVELTHHEAILLFKEMVEYVRDKLA